MTEAKAIDRRIAQIGAGKAFTAADEGTIETLARNLTDDQVDTVMRKPAGLTSWVGEAAKKIWKAKHGQDS